MNTEDTRRLVTTSYETLPTGDRGKLASLLTEDVEWFPPQHFRDGLIARIEDYADTRKAARIMGSDA